MQERQELIANTSAQSSFEIPVQDERYSESDLKFELTHLITEFLEKPLQGNPEIKKDALEKLSACIRKASSQNLRYEFCLQEMIVSVFMKQKSQRKMQIILIGLGRLPDKEVRLFALKGMFLMVSECFLMNKPSKIMNRFLLSLFKSLEAPGQTLKNWAACSLCLLTDENFQDFKLIQQYTENLLKMDDVFWNKYIAHALLFSLEMQDRVKPLTLKKMDEALRLSLKNDSYMSNIRLKEQQLQLISLHHLRHIKFISESILDFVLEQYQVPELTVLTAHLCFTIILKVRLIDEPLPPGRFSLAKCKSFLASDYFSKILDKLYHYAIHPEFSPSMISFSASRVVFRTSEENIITTLVKLYNITITEHLFDNSIKLLVLLFEAGTVLEKGQEEYQRRTNHYLQNFQKIIDGQRLNNKPLLGIYNLLITLLQHKHSEIRLFAAKAILIAVWDGYFESQNSDLERQQLFFPVLLEQLNDQTIEIRKWVAGSLCYLSFDKPVDAQLLVSYTEQLLETNDFSWQKTVLLGLDYLSNDHHFFLSETSIARIVDLCIKPESKHGWFRNEALLLFCFQMEHSGKVLPMDILKECLNCAKEEEPDAEKKILGAEYLLRLIGANFQKLKGLKTIPKTVIAVIFNYFDMPEVRSLAYSVFYIVNTACIRGLQIKLESQLYSKLRAFAQAIDPDMQKFVMSILNGINVYLPEKEEILAIIKQQGHLELHQIADVLGTSLSENQEARNNALARLSAYIKKTGPQDLRSETCFQEMIPLLLKKEELLHKMQNFLIELLSISDDEIRLFALKQILLLVFECFRLDKISDIENKFRPALINSLKDPNQTLGNWAACSLCFLLDPSFPDLELISAQIQNLLELEEPFWNKYIVRAYLFTMVIVDRVQPLTCKKIEEILQITIKDGAEQKQITLKEQQLQIIGFHYLQHKAPITDLILDFVLEQFQIPKLRILTARLFYTFILQVDEIYASIPSGSSLEASTKSFRQENYYSVIMEKLFQFIIDPETKPDGEILSWFELIVFDNPEENIATVLVKLFNFAVEDCQFDNAIKILLFLFELGSSYENGPNKYKELVKYYLENFGKIIAYYLAENKPLSDLQNLLIRLLQHKSPEIRSLAAQSIIISIHTIYMKTFITDECKYPYAEMRQLFLPVLLDKLKDPSQEIRNWVACSLCYFEIDEGIDPQLLVSYAENLLETNSIDLAKISTFALCVLFYRYNCLLSQTAISRVITLCQKPNFLPAYFRVEALSLLNFQVQYSEMPLPVNIIEQCLNFPKEADNNFEKNKLAESLLKLIGRNFEKQEAVQSIPATISDAILNNFDKAEQRQFAWRIYRIVLLACGKKEQTILVRKVFPKLRTCARNDDPEMKKFVSTVLQEINGYQQEKDDVLASLEQSEEAELLVTEAQTSNKASDEKDLDTLLAELAELNINNPNVCELLTSNDLVASLAAVKATYTSDSHFLPAGIPIENWDVGHCQAWAQAVIQNKTQACAKDFQTEMIAVIMRASILDSGQTPRNIQLLSLLTLLKAESRGCLAEVKTGEGKTKIVSMFAALKALQVDFVDVVSSSTILAKRDAHEMQNFYSILKLTVADNIDGKEHDGKAARPCYSANIVYGDTNEYQWDIIREAMEEKITRGGRPFRIMFFDEVDSLLVDRAERGAMIVNSHPALEYVKHVMVAVWHMMVRIGQSIVAKEGQWVYQSADGKNEIKVHNLIHFANSLLKKYITSLVEDPNSPILLPKHLKTFILVEIDEFAEAAVGAYYRYHPDKHYVITENFRDEEKHQVITIVDNNLTGEILKNTRWTYLHSYLELKHGLKMGPPQLMGNYLSTPGLCKRYGNQIYGLTGTLGGADTQALLKEMYHLDLAFIPTYKPKCLTEYRGIVAPTKNAWLGEIIRSVQDMVSQKRPVLVIAATIADVIYLENELIKAKVCRKITRFSRNDTDEINTPSQAMEAGEVIIATLIAGRGIDWYFARHQIDLIEEQGGLHIMVTSLPLNLRVEQQIFGRTARKGNRGSAQLIINREEMYHRFREEDSKYFDNIETIKVLRDEVEAKRVYQIKTQGIRLALLKDDLYLRFRSFINSIKGEEDSKHRIGGIEEQWAYWLQQIAKNQESDFNPDTTLPLIEVKFEQFLEAMRHDLGIIRKNPCRQVQQGNMLSCQKHKFSEAIAAYTNTIQDDPLVGVQAYYNRAEAHIFAKGPNYSDAVLADLQMAKTNLENHIIPQLNAMLVVHNLNPVTTNGFTNDFAKQIHCKIELLKMEIANIDQNINIIHQARHQARKAKQKVDFEVCEFKNLQDFFPDASTRPVAELEELYSSGLSHLFSIQPFFRPKKSRGFGALCVAFLGVLQIAVGVLVSCAAPMIGSMLIQEGINDIIYAARALISGNFDWNAYLANKIGSVSITVISMGLEMLKNSAELGIASEAAKGQNALKNLATRQLNYEKLLEIAKEEVVKRVIDAGVREVFNFAVDKLTTVAMDRFSGEIEDLVGKRLKHSLGSPDCQSALDAMFQLDLANKNAVMQGQLDRMASKILNEKLNLIHTVANSIIKGVLANQHSNVRTFLRIADMGMAMDKILQLTDNFAKQFRAELLFFYHQQIAHSPQSSTIDQNGITPLKNQFYSSITKRLAQRVIATAKGEIINPGIDMAMNDHLNNIANQIKQVALQPVPVEHLVAVTEQPSKAEKKAKSTSVPSKSSFGKQLMERRDAARHSEFKEAYEKVRVPHKPITAPIEIKPNHRPSVQAKSVAPMTRETSTQRYIKGTSVGSVMKKETLPDFLPEDVDTLFRRMHSQVSNFKTPPLARFISNMYGELKSHDSMAQYVLDGMRMYPPVRYLEGLALIGDYSKDNGLHKKAIQSWTTKLKTRDPFADDSFRAASTLVLLEHLATGMNAVKKYTTIQLRERFDQLNLFLNLMRYASTLPSIPSNTDRLVEHGMPGASCGSAAIVGNGLTTNRVKLFDVNKNNQSKNRHRFFHSDNSGSTAEPPSCSAWGYTEAAMRGCYNGMDLLGHIPHNPPSATSGVYKEIAHAGCHFFGVRPDKDEHLGAQQLGACLGGAIVELYEHHNECNQ